LAITRHRNRIVEILAGLSVLGVLWYAVTGVKPLHPSRQIARESCARPVFDHFPEPIASAREAFEKWSPPLPGGPLPYNVAQSAIEQLHQSLQIPLPANRLTSPWALLVYVFPSQTWESELGAKFTPGSAIINGGLLVHQRTPTGRIASSEYSEEAIRLRNDGTIARIPIPVGGFHSGLIGHYLWVCGEGTDRLISITARGPASPIILDHTGAPNVAIDLYVDGEAWKSDLKLTNCQTLTRKNSLVRSNDLGCAEGTFTNPRSNIRHQLGNTIMNHQSIVQFVTPTIDDRPLIALPAGITYR
jgi:hypothetical protein